MGGDSGGSRAGSSRGRSGTGTGGSKSGGDGGGVGGGAGGDGSGGSGRARSGVGTGGQKTGGIGAGSSGLGGLGDGFGGDSAPSISRISSTPMSLDEMNEARKGVNNLGKWNGFTPGFGFLGFNIGTAPNPEGLLDGTTPTQNALGFSGSQFTLDGLSLATRLPVSTIARIAGYRPADYSTIATFGNIGDLGAPSAASHGAPGGMGGNPSGGAGSGGNGTATGAGQGALANLGSTPTLGMQYVPFTGDPYTYGFGAEHNFFQPIPVPAGQQVAQQPQAQAQGVRWGFQY
jgi:hypothetical protein